MPSPLAEDPRIGLTRARSALKPSQRRVLGVAAGAVSRLRLARPLTRLLIRLRDRWMPTSKHGAFRGYTPTSHDVLVCTYAKSGTNWLLQIVHQIATLGAGEFDHIHDVAPWPDSLHPTGATLDDGGHAYAPTGLRVIKTHLEAPHVPYAPAARYLFVVRDPKDALASAYHFGHSVAHIYVDVRFDAEEFAAICLADRIHFGSWAEHTASWWPLRARDNVLVITFKELLQDLEAVVRRVEAFVGVELTDEQRARVVERSGFAWMKEHDAAFRPPMEPLPGREPAVMVRTGKRGGSRGLFSPETVAALDRFFQSELRRRGSDFPYERLIAGEPLEPTK